MSEQENVLSTEQRAKVKKLRPRLIIACTLLAGLIFAADLSVPLGVAGGVPYVSLVLLSVWFPRHLHVVLAAAAGTVLTVAGFFLSPPGGPLWIVLFNRALALFTIWVTAGLGIRYRIALLKSKAKNRAMLNAVPDLLIVMSRDGTYLDWKAGENTTPLVPPEEFLGRNITEILPAEVAEQALRHIRESLATGRTQLFVYELLQDDETHSFEARISPCGIDEVLILIRDITESKEQEQSLRDLSHRLLRLQDEERRRIARELHDSSAQSLAALAINLSILKQRISTPDPVARKALADSNALAKQCSLEISNLSHLLHPPLLDEAGLSHALRSYAHGITLRNGIRVDLNLSPQLEKAGQLPRDIETAVFRVAQECLTNIQRHADSATAQVRIELDSTHVRVEAGDQGRGIPPEKLKTPRRLTAYRGLGIPGMRERVRQLGGTFQIDTSPRGTKVTVTIPLQEDRK